MPIRTRDQWYDAWDERAKRYPSTDIECRECGYWTEYPADTEMPHPDDDPLWCACCGSGGILEGEQG